MKKLLIATLSLILGSTALFAQNEIDALRYSRLNPTGTARFTAMGGAFGALGADFSTLSNNPAGIGLYKSSEVTVTPSLYFGKTESTYFGDFSEDDKYNFNLGNAGIVIVSPIRKPESDWKNIQFGFGVNRLNNYNNRVLISGFNDASSLLTPYWLEANKYELSLGQLDNYGSGLAYDAELMYDTAVGKYLIDMPYGGVKQRKSIETRGSMNEMVLSIGANYDNFIYLGATLGIPFFKYKETSIYTETDTEDNNNYFDSFTKTDELITEGSGINLKVGMIIRPSDWFRIGAAIETPTFFTEMSDSYNTTFKSQFTDTSLRKSSPLGFYEYELQTPFKAMAGVGFIIGKSGLISADYQYIDYSKARLRAPDHDFDTENEAIKNGYLAANNFRLGAEWRVGAVSLRGGYAISDNPYSTGTNSAINTFSAGLGIRANKFFVDFSLLMNDMDDEYHLYSLPEEFMDANDPDYPKANVTVNNTMFLFTLGYKY
ncbi:MAG TPA: hypothetical protein VK212_04295 [Lentimicrobium sp.]|nr:hypothetical protein [Lentimicrobium sp.]